MIRVTIEMSASKVGEEVRRTKRYVMDIRNDGAGGDQYGNYDVGVKETRTTGDKPTEITEFRITGWPRQYSGLRLVMDAIRRLDACLRSRPEEGGENTS